MLCTVNRTQVAAAIILSHANVQPVSEKDATVFPRG